MNSHKSLLFGLLVIIASVSISMKYIAIFEANALAPQTSYIELFKFGRSIAAGITWQPNSNNLAVANLEGVSMFSNGFEDELVIQGFPSGFRDIQWSFSENLVAGLKYTATEVVIWNVQTSSVQASLQDNTSRISSMAWSYDNTKLATGDRDGIIKIWDVSNGAHISTLNHERAVHSISWSPDSTRLVSVGIDRRAKVWDVANQVTEIIFDQHTGQISDVEWNPVEDKIASVGDGGLMIWNPNDGQLIGRFPGSFFVEWSPDGDKVFTKGENETIAMWDIASGLVAVTFAGHGGDELSDIALSADGDYLATRSTGIKTFENVRVWNATTGDLVKILPGFTRWVSSVAWSPDDSQVSSTHSNLVRLWDMTTGELAELIEFEFGYDLVWNQDWSWIAGAGLANSIEVWDIELNPPPATVGLEAAHGTPGHDYPGGMENLTWNPAGNRFATSAEDGTVRIWNVSSQSVDPSLVLWLGDDPNDTSYASDIAWSPDGSRIAVALNGGRVKVWNSTQAGDPLAVLQHGTDYVYAVTWHPNGTQIISAYLDEPLDIWNADTYQQVTTWPNSTFVNVFSWEPNADFLVSGNLDGSIQTWDASSGQLVDAFQAHAEGITSIAWSHDGEKFASGSADGTIKIWGEALSCDIEVGDSDEAGLVSAINTANGSGQPMTICLAEDSTYALTTAAASSNNGKGGLEYTGLPFITGNITIEGQGATITRSGSNQFRLIKVNAGGSLTLKDVTLSNGSTTTSGGAIWNSGTLTINESSVTNNTATVYGGGIYNAGTLTLTNTTLSSNHGVGGGGGLRNDGGTATIEASSFTGNDSTGGGGGAISNASGSSITITDSVLTTNRAGMVSGSPSPHNQGGAINNAGTLTMTGSSLTNNVARTALGGSILAGGTTIVHETCFSGNSATSVHNPTQTPRNFTNNWWGAANGPAGAGPGSGDSVSTNINFSGFITTGCPN